MPPSVCFLNCKVILRELEMSRLRSIMGPCPFVPFFGFGCGWGGFIVDRSGRWRADMAKWKSTACLRTHGTPFRPFRAGWRSCGVSSPAVYALFLPRTGVIVIACISAAAADEWRLHDATYSCPYLQHFLLSIGRSLNRDTGWRTYPR